MHEFRKLLTIVIVLLLLALPVVAQDAEAIEVGDSVDGELTEDALEALYTFSGEQGQLVTITLVSENFDAYLRLRDETGAELAANDDGAGSLNSRIGPFDLPENGEYTIVATSLSGSATGEFTLSLETVTLQTVEYTQSVEGELTDEALTQTYRFTGQAGDVVTIGMESGDFDSYLELAASSSPNSSLTTDDDSGEGYNALIGPFTLPETDVYLITARSLSSTSTGEYTLTLNKTEVSELVVGETLEVELEENTPLYFSFEATNGQEVTITVDSGDTIDTMLALRGPTGNYNLITDDDSGGRLDPEIQRYLITEEGIYTVLLSPFSSVDKGTLTISLAEAEAASLDEGPQALRLSEKRNRERVVFEGYAGEKVRLTFAIEGDSPISPYIDLTQGDTTLGNYSFPNVEEVAFVITIPDDGEVSVIVTDYSYVTNIINVTLERLGE